MNNGTIRENAIVKTFGPETRRSQADVIADFLIMFAS